MYKQFKVLINVPYMTKEKMFTYVRTKLLHRCTFISNRLKFKFATRKAFYTYVCAQDQVAKTRNHTIKQSQKYP